jgi:hypothetical protein
MRRSLLILLLLGTTTSLARAQDIPPEPTQNPDATYRLFRTKNIYTFLKLDTRDGELWQVQWGDSEHRFSELINSVPLALRGKPGRFTLYPTTNVFTFLLLDQETGDTWHVQWGKAADRFVAPINPGVGER